MADREYPPKSWLPDEEPIPEPTLDVEESARIQAELDRQLAEETGLDLEILPAVIEGGRSLKLDMGPAVVEKSYAPSKHRTLEMRYAAKPDTDQSRLTKKYEDRAAWPPGEHEVELTDEDRRVQEAMKAEEEIAALGIDPREDRSDAVPTGYPPSHWMADEDAPLDPYAETEQGLVEDESAPEPDVGSPYGPVPEDPYGPEAEAILAQGAVREAQREQFGAGLKLAEAERQRKMAEDIARVTRAGEEAVAKDLDAMRAEIDAYKATKVNPNRWRDSRGTGQVILGAITAGMSGYLNPSGPNSTIAIMDKEIERDIQAQMTNMDAQAQALQFRRGAIQDRVAMNERKRLAADALRLAYLETADEIIASQMAGLDPEGTQYQRAVETRLNFKKEAEKIKYDREIKARELGHREKELELQRDQIEMHERASKRSAWVARQGQKDEMTRWREGEDLRKAQAENLRAEAEQKKTAGSTAANKIAREDYERTVPTLVQPDGTQFVARTDDDAKKAKAIKAQMDYLDRLLRKRIALRAQEGGAAWGAKDIPLAGRVLPGGWGSDMYKRMKEIDSELKGALKDAMELGAWDKGSQEFLEGMVGDTAGLADPTPQTSQLREHMYAKAEDTVRAMGFKGALMPRDETHGGGAPKRPYTDISPGEREWLIKRYEEELPRARQELGLPAKSPRSGDVFDDRSRQAMDTAMQRAKAAQKEARDKASLGGAGM
jgi:hypothetical protein